MSFAVRRPVCFLIHFPDAVQTAIEGHKKDLQFERDTLHEMEYKEKQATAKRAQLEREVASLRQKASQDTSGRGEIWSKLMKQREEHEAAIAEKEVNSAL